MENITSGERIRVTLKLLNFFIAFEVLTLFSFSLVSPFSQNFSTVYTY